MFTTKDTARATELSDPCGGAVKFKRSFPEGLSLFREQNQTNNQSTLLVKGSSGILSCPGSAPKLPEGNKTDTSPGLNWNCCLTLVFKTFYSKATEKKLLCTWRPLSSKFCSLLSCVWAACMMGWELPLARSCCLPGWDTSGDTSGIRPGVGSWGNLVQVLALGDVGGLWHCTLPRLVLFVWENSQLQEGKDWS